MLIWNKAFSTHASTTAFRQAVSCFHAAHFLSPWALISRQTSFLVCTCADRPASRSCTLRFKLPCASLMQSCMPRGSNLTFKYLNPVIFSTCPHTHIHTRWSFPQPSYEDADVKLRSWRISTATVHNNVLTLLTTRLLSEEPEDNINTLELTHPPRAWWCFSLFLSLRPPICSSLYLAQLQISGKEMIRQNKWEENHHTFGYFRRKRGLISITRQQILTHFNHQRIFWPIMKFPPSSSKHLVLEGALKTFFTPQHLVPTWCSSKDRHQTWFYTEQHCRRLSDWKCVNV